MALQAWIHNCALEMLSLEELPLDLRNYLDEIEMYANLSGGSIQSRQIVAVALVNYMDRKAFLNGLDDLKEFVRYEE
tara:strand:- start:119 stop:349 length:231 start_codon:yes stop_codon:yes gene_type:complete